MFSHTTKGQPYNMPLLSRFVQFDANDSCDLLPRLIDYEMLTDSNGKRTVGFGWFAGGEIVPLVSTWMVIRRFICRSGWYPGIPLGDGPFPSRTRCRFAVFGE
jgi:hypothetical protein